MLGAHQHQTIGRTHNTGTLPETGRQDRRSECGGGARQGQKAAFMPGSRHDAAQRMRVTCDPYAIKGLQQPSSRFMILYRHV